MNRGLHLKIVFIAVFMAAFLFGQAQTAFQISVREQSTPLSGVSVVLSGSEERHGVTDSDGEVLFEDVKTGSYRIQLRLLGYINISDSLVAKTGSTVFKTFEMQEDKLRLNEVVVTGMRHQIERYESPIIINTISSKTFEASQALTIAEGLSFSPGLRMENNCQNCGFTQLRMNGLEGPYSQILINSRPVFSALAGVYGLEMLPVNMIDRVEVVRGGGSVLYGGNAIAGTVNIITKDPIANRFEVGINQAFTDFEASDRTLTFNGALVNENKDKGVTLFGFNRNRNPWDANGDGFSEITQLRNTTFGFDAFWNPSAYSKLKLGLYSINEFRRGGNRFELMPHQSDLAEQLQHNILSSHVSFEQMSKDFKHKIAVYGSLQHIQRQSYYGAGGRVLVDGDTLTEMDITAINAYGSSTDLSFITGVQYNYEWSKNIALVAGVEHNNNVVNDAMPGYDRIIDQQVGTTGTYAQVEFKPGNLLTIVIGGRYDHVSIRGRYSLSNDNYPVNKNLNVVVPRLSVMYHLLDNLKVRGSFAQGYRGPQAFDEDLHIETVGGSARFIQLSTDLETERSNSYLLSLNYDQSTNNRQFNFVLEGFYTELNNPFILSDQRELDNGVAVITKRNGAAATVAGVNVEANIALGRKWVLQSGATLQSARYAVEEEIWAPEEGNSAAFAVATDRLLRTPNAYGFFTLVYEPAPKWKLSYSGIITGSMWVAHVIDPETEQTVLKETPSFFENNLKISHTIKAAKENAMEVFFGVQNLFDSYQKDFDLGVNRDAGYVYGPMRPRTVFMGLKFGF